METNRAPATHATRLLDAMLQRGIAPGMQYVVVRADGIHYEFAGGLADIAHRRTVTSATTFLTYSISKVVTAVAVLQLVERGQLSLDEPAAPYAAPWPYDAAVTVRQLLSHTAGLPNPLPLRWVHPANVDAHFRDDSALDSVLAQHGRQSAPPGARFQYSNIGYWLLGRIVERVAGMPFRTYVARHACAPLDLRADDLGYTIPNTEQHARGYLERWSLLNLCKRLIIDRALIGDAVGAWVNIRDHVVDGAAFGGVVATARGLGRVLQALLQESSPLLGARGQALLREPQHRRDGATVPMTLGWHVEQRDGRTCLYKEGGGAGFHGLMRVYPHAGMGAVFLTNATRSNVRQVMDAVDPLFVGEAHAATAGTRVG